MTTYGSWSKMANFFLENVWMKFVTFLDASCLYFLFFYKNSENFKIWLYKIVIVNNEPINGKCETLKLSCGCQKDSFKN